MMSQLNFLQLYKKLLAKQQDIELELAIAYPRSSDVARHFKRIRGGYNFHIFFKRRLTFFEQN